MNRYEKTNAAERIAGYYLPRPHETGKALDVFERAKAETLTHMRNALKQTEDLTADDYFAERRIKPNAPDQPQNRHEVKHG